MFSAIIDLFKMLNSASAPWQIASGIALGMVVGLTPLWSLHNLLVLLIVCLLTVHFNGFLLGWALFSALALAINPLSAQLGQWLLLHSELQELWTALYQVPAWRWTHFNHTLTLGSFALALSAFIPVVLLAHQGVVVYRTHLRKVVAQWHIVQLIKASKLFQFLYSRTV